MHTSQLIASKPWLAARNRLPGSIVIKNAWAWEMKSQRKGSSELCRVPGIVECVCRRDKVGESALS